MTDETTRSASKERSPNYPSMGLPDAIAAARKLWQVEKRTTVPPDVAAQALGYNSLSGASRAALAALRQFGLVDVSPGGVTVSDLAVAIAVHPEGSTEWEKAVRTAADYPDLFREIRDTHSDASDSALNAYLITKRRFSVEGAKRFIRAFRETTDLANRMARGYSEASEQQPTAHGDHMAAPSPAPTAQPVVNQPFTAMQFLLGGGFRAEIRMFGGDVEPSHIRKLGSLLKAQADTMEEA